MFVGSEPLSETHLDFSDITRLYHLDNKDDEIQLEQLFRKILDSADLGVPFENQSRDIRNILSYWKNTLCKELPGKETLTLEILNPLFFRNKGTYIVGRLMHSQGIMPLLLPIIHNEQGAVYVDALIHEADDASMIFSFTRSYFMVEAPVPSRIVSFLKKLMPNKELAELYNAIGLNKHGKTEFYRSFVNHLAQSDDQFIVAPDQPVAAQARRSPPQQGQSPGRPNHRRWLGHRLQDSRGHNRRD